MKPLQHIIKECLKKNRKAQQELYNYTYVKLAASVAVYTKDSSERDWVFNLGMMRVFSNLRNFSLHTNYLGWSKTILVRSAIDHYRSNRKHKNLIAIESIGYEVNSQDFEHMMNRLESEELIRIIQLLPERERVVFSMYEIDGYTHREIEDISGIKSNTSKWLLAKAKKSLKAQIVNSQILLSEKYGQ